MVVIFYSCNYGMSRTNLFHWFLIESVNMSVRMLESSSARVIDITAVACLHTITYIAYCIVKIYACALTFLHVIILTLLLYVYVELSTYNTLN